MGEGREHRMGGQEVEWVKLEIEGEIGQSWGRRRPRETNGREEGRGDEWRVLFPGQLQLEAALMHCKWSGQCFEWSENILLSSIYIEKRPACSSIFQRMAQWTVYYFYGNISIDVVCPFEAIIHYS